METLTTNITEMLLDPRRSQKQAEQADKIELVRRLREYQLTTVEKRHKRVMSKFDLVEDMFDKAVTRRMRAHQRIAADPPADRLIGRSMLQYIPASLLEVKNDNTEVCMQKNPEEPPLQRSTSPSSPPAIAPSSSPLPLLMGGTEKQSKTNAIVFLTEMDGKDQQQQPPPPALPELPPTSEEEGTLLPWEGADLQSENSLLAANELARVHRNNIDALYDHRVGAERVKEWRALGYHAVYVGRREPIRCRRTGLQQQPPRQKGRATGSSSAPAMKRKARLAAEGTNETEKPSSSSPTASTTSSSVANPYTTTHAFHSLKLDPLPPMCLVQRRLAVEDMALEEVLEESRRYQRFASSIPLKNVKKNASRRRKLLDQQQPAVAQQTYQQSQGILQLQPSSRSCSGGDGQE